MSNPNIVNVQGILGQTTYVIPNVNTPVVLLANGSGSANVYKIGVITVANLSAGAQTATVSYYTNGAQSQNTAPAGGVTATLINQVSIPANASLVVMDKTSPIYLPENSSLVVTTPYPSQLSFVTSYEQIY